MKRLFLASDIHGSYSATKSIIEAYEREQCDKLILLGDLYYHGPRNPLPDEYCPKKVAELLNSYADKLIVIKGNCDAEVDQMISEFPFVSRKVLHSFGRNIFLTHGHLYNSDNMPKLNVGDVLCYGHFHEGKLYIKEGVNIVALGSASLPKNNTPPSYAVMDKEGVVLKKLDGETINTIKF